MAYSRENINLPRAGTGKYGVDTATSRMSGFNKIPGSRYNAGTGVQREDGQTYPRDIIEQGGDGQTIIHAHTTIVQGPDGQTIIGEGITILQGSNGQTIIDNRTTQAAYNPSRSKSVMDTTTTLGITFSSQAVASGSSPDTTTSTPSTEILASSSTPASSTSPGTSFISNITVEPTVSTQSSPETNISRSSLGGGAIAGIVLAVVGILSFTLYIFIRQCTRRTTIPTPTTSTTRLSIAARISRPPAYRDIEPYHVTEFDCATWAEDAATVRKFNTGNI